MASTERFLDERTYDQIQELNGHLGALFATDLSVLMAYGPQLPVKIPRILPKAVQPTRFPQLRLASERGAETIKSVEGVTALDHGREIHYELAYDQDGQLQEIRRHRGPRGKSSYDRLSDARSHYHVTEVTDGIRGDHGYQPTRPIGAGLLTFDDAMEKFVKEAEIYIRIASGELEPGKQSVSIGQFPPVDLGSLTYKAYLIGFRNTLERLELPEHRETLDQVVDSLPY
jgi:hypothetical protein